MDQTIKDTLYLLSCAVKTEIPDKNRIALMDFEKILQISEKHMVTAAIGMALNSAGVKNKLFEQAVNKAIRKTIILNETLSKIRAEFETAKIWNMPLKGAVLQSYYPKFGMREMADIDILIDNDRSVEVRTIMEKNGFSVKSFGINNVDSYIKAPLSNIEIHKSLFGVQHQNKFYKYYINVKERLIKDEENNYGYHFSVEDFYVFMLAHEYKHYQSGGTGLRSLLDIYVYLQKNELNWTYVNQELMQLGIIEFEQQNRNLAFALFCDKKEVDVNSLEYILNSGVFGTLEQLVQNKMNKWGNSKILYLTRRLFGVYNNNYWDYLKQRHPFFYRHKVLLVFLPFYRLIYGIIKYPKRIREEIKTVFRQ